MKSTIYGSGANSIVTLYRIHQGGCYFKKDTSTAHSQIELLQTELNNRDFNCGTPDGKYGDNTVSGVKKFQKAKALLLTVSLARQVLKHSKPIWAMFILTPVTV